MMRQEIDEAIKRVVDSGKFILDKEVKAFEREFASYCGVGYAVGVASGTEAIALALMSLDIKPGDEVITVSHTATGTVCGIVMAGAKPVYVDIGEDYLMNPALIAEKITPKTRAIVPVHLYGRMCDMEAIMRVAEKYGLWVVEDCAQSVGAGELRGDMGCYSFYPTKNLGAFGDGGCIVLRNNVIYKFLKESREYGWSPRFCSSRRGLNSRLDEIQAAVLRVKLKYLRDELIRRSRVGTIYNLNLEGFVKLPPVGTYHQYVIRVDRKVRDRIVKELGYQVHYPIPCHRQPVYYDEADLPVTEKVCQEIVSMPMKVDIVSAKDAYENVKQIIREESNG